MAEAQPEAVQPSTRRTRQARDEISQDRGRYSSLSVTGAIGDESGPGGLEDPGDVAVYQDMLYVTDYGRDLLLVFCQEPDGEYRYFSHTPIAKPMGCAVNRFGTVSVTSSKGDGYVTQFKHRSVSQALTACCVFKPKIKGMRRAYGLTYDCSGEALYVSCGEEHVVQFARDGDGIVARYRPPRHLGRCSAGSVAYLKDTMLVVYQAMVRDVTLCHLVLYSGEDLQQRRVVRPDCLKHPESVAEDGANYLIVDSGKRCIHVMTTEGRVLTRVATGDVEPWWLAASEGTWFVSANNLKILVISQCERDTANGTHATTDIDAENGSGAVTGSERETRDNTITLGAEAARRGAATPTRAFPVGHSTATRWRHLTDVHTVHGRSDPLSNFYRVDLSLRGVKVPSAEHAYQYLKATAAGSPRIADAILQCRQPYEAKQLAKELPRNANWVYIKREQMKLVLEEKLKQVPAFREALCGTGSKTIALTLVKEMWWSTGLFPAETLLTEKENWPGRNVMGQLLEEIREECSANKPESKGKKTKKKKSRAQRQQAKQGGVK